MEHAQALILGNFRATIEEIAARLALMLLFLGAHI
jgi:hypothetical protein